MRCPHCASNRVAPPICRTCGRRLDEGSDQPVLAGLEPTRVASATAEATALDGLEPTALPPVAVAAVAPVAELEPTAREVPEVAAERMSGLVTNEGASAPAAPEATPAAPAGRCPRCHADTVEQVFCPRCGYRVRARHPGASTETAPPLVCLECSVPNPPGRVLCMSCGKRLLHP